jgi:hypothetical protein
MPENPTACEPSYALAPSEQRQVDEIKEQIAANGGLYLTDRDGNLVPDGTGNPIPVDHVILRTRRFLVDARGVVWRFFPEGAKKDPTLADGGGAPWRNNRVEMWTGQWRKVAGPDGETQYAKVLNARPIDKRINGHPGMTQIEWYRTVKGYKHPFDPPHAPTAEQMADLERGRAGASTQVRARMSAELTKAGTTAAANTAAADQANAETQNPKARRRTNTLGVE